MECGELRCSVERLKASLQDQWQENTELVSRVTSQAADILALQNANTELLSKLNMSELVAKQVRQLTHTHKLHAHTLVLCTCTSQFHQ